MKKNFMFAMMSAIALTGAVNLTSCSSSDEVTEEVNPTYDGESVKTQFSISVGEVKAPTTRMASTAVQEDKAFKGMTDIYLIPAKSAITDGTTFTEDVIKLDDFTLFDKSSTGATSTNAKIYNDVKLSVGVNNFLFYAAIPDGYKDNGELKPSYLKVDKTAFDGDADWTATTVFNQNATVGGITFDLVPYQKDKTINAVQAAGADVVAVLNAINTALEAQITAATGNDNNTKSAMTAKLSKLRNFVDLDNDGIQDQGETEYKAYAGSALSIKALAEDVYNFGKNLDNTYGEALCTAITGAGLTESGNATDGFTLSWTTDPNFPGSLNLPDGAVAVKYNATDNKFVYTDEVNIEGLTSPTISTYTHPARLYYTVNTPAKVKNATYLKDLAGTEAWSNVVAAYTDGAAISSTTKSVIMQDQVQYAVGRLDVQVRVDNTVNLKDNGSGITGSSDKDPQLVSVPTAGYALTGVLIGNQYQANWKFLPTGDPKYTIWDGSMTGAIAAKVGSDYSAANHTLALETPANIPVRIALEFENTGNDFYGINHNIIPKGTKFYLVAELDPTKPANIGSNPSSLNQVFKQDYITTAQLTIHETALQKAYNVIPDLRSPQLEFGFSVNLEWQKGITFTQTFQ